MLTNTSWRFKVFIFISCVTGLLVSTTVHAQALTLAGTGSAESLMRHLFTEYQKQSPSSTLTIVKPPLGSGGAIKALANGKIHIAVSGRPLKPSEASAVGASFVLASTPFVMASAVDNPKRDLTTAELVKIYAGETREWRARQPIRLLVRASIESDTLTLKAISNAMEQAVTQAASRPGMVMPNNDIETLEMIEKTPGSLGPTTLGMIKTQGARVSVFSLNGIAPTLANLKNNRYPWQKSLIVILPREASREALSFVSFLKSPAAQKLLLQYEYLPTAP